MQVCLGSSRSEGTGDVCNSRVQVTGTATGWRGQAERRFKGSARSLRRSARRPAERGNNALPQPGFPSKRWNFREWKRGSEREVRGKLGQSV